MVSSAGQAGLAPRGPRWCATASARRSWASSKPMVRIGSPAHSTERTGGVISTVTRKVCGGRPWRTTQARPSRCSAHWRRSALLRPQTASANSPRSRVTSRSMTSNASFSASAARRRSARLRAGSGGSGLMGAASAASIVGLTLLDEGAHTFLLVLAAEQGVEGGALGLEPFAQGELVGLIDGGLGQADGERRLAGDLARQLQRFVEIDLAGDHAADEPRLLGLAGGHGAAGA